MPHKTRKTSNKMSPKRGRRFLWGRLERTFKDFYHQLVKRDAGMRGLRGQIGPICHTRNSVNLMHIRNMVWPDDNIHARNAMTTQRPMGRERDLPGFFVEGFGEASRQDKFGQPFRILGFK